MQQLRERMRALAHGDVAVARPSTPARTPAWCGAFGLASIARGAVHEVLSASTAATPRQFALLLAQAAHASDDRETDDDARVIAWIEEPNDPWYAPAVARFANVPIERILVLHPPPARDAKPALWALAECLGSPGVRATIARVPDKLSAIDARRLQLAAERGGGLGVLLRTHQADPRRAAARPLHYAAATRWLVEPAPAASPRTQRFRITLLHGQGGRIGHPVALEVDRESPQTNRVRAFEELAGQPFQATTRPPQQRWAAGG